MIFVDVTKAKTIAHAMRREARSLEFAPYDAVIGKQIPGADAAAAEVARQAIRAKYATIQTQIDAAQDAGGLKEIVVAFLPKRPVDETPAPMAQPAVAVAEGGNQ